VNFTTSVSVPTCDIILVEAAQPARTFKAEEVKRIIRRHCSVMIMWRTIWQSVQFAISTSRCAVCKFLT